MTSSRSIPWNQDRPRYAESVYDQISNSYRREREITPMSFHSASGMQPRNFQNSYYTSRMSSNRSMYNGRSRSPGSVRTIDSNTSISARDIVFALKTGNFNKFDFEIIKDAFRVRFRRQSGGDLGYQASDSSISSDDCRSKRNSKSTFYKENTSTCRSTRTDLSDLRRSVIESNMFRDCTENFGHNSFKNMFGVGPANVRDDSRNKMQNSSVVSQKDRLKTWSLLPSQRFNQSVASLPIPENPEKVQQSQNNKCMNMKTKIISQNSNTDQRRSNETESEKEEIFANVTVMERNSYNNNGKRGLDDDALSSDKKRAKLSSPQKTNFKPKTPNQKVTDPMFKQRPNKFIFAKPQFPVRKTSLVKNQQKIIKSSQPEEKSKLSIQPEEKIITKSLQASVKEPITKSQELPREKLISSLLKSAEKMVSKTPLVVEKAPVEKLITKCLQTLDVQNTLETKSPQNMVDEKEPWSQPETPLSTTYMSMRPSFIKVKRKLFTQKVDEAEKNSSSDSLQVDSLQTNIYTKIQKEKNKARKLVTTQSCLNRDVLGMQMKQMNATTATNRSVAQNNKSKSANSDKWDVTTMISTCTTDKKQLEEAEAMKKEAALMAKEIEKRQKEYMEKQKLIHRLENDKMLSSRATRATTSSRATRATISSRATRATTSSRARRATTSSRALRATTSSRATRATTSSRATRATTSSRALRATTSSRATRATTSSRATSATTSSRDDALPPEPRPKRTRAKKLNSKFDNGREETSGQAPQEDKGRRHRVQPPQAAGGAVTPHTHAGQEQEEKAAKIRVKNREPVPAYAIADADRDSDLGDDSPVISESGSEVSAVPKPKKKELPANAAAMHPCTLLTYMRQPEYRELDVSYDRPQNSVFTLGVDVDGSTYIGKASNKKEARKQAARAACAELFGVTYSDNPVANAPQPAD